MNAFPDARLHIRDREQIALNGRVNDPLSPADNSGGLQPGMALAEVGAHEAGH